MKIAIYNDSFNIPHYFTDTIKAVDFAEKDNKIILDVDAVKKDIRETGQFIIKGCGDLNSICIYETVFN